MAAGGICRTKRQIYGKTVKKEEKDLSIDDMLKLFVKEDDEKKPVKKGISFNIDTDNSKWHS